MRAAILALALTGCAGQSLDVCKYAGVRRMTYTAAINAANVYEASGRPVPEAVRLGREAAQTALAILNVNCPATYAGQNGATRRS